MFKCESCQHWFETPNVLSHIETADEESQWEEKFIDSRECPKCGSTKLSYHEIP